MDNNTKYRLKNIFNIQYVLIPIFLCVVFMPMFVAFFWYVSMYHSGSILSVTNEICPDVSIYMSISTLTSMNSLIEIFNKCNCYHRFLDIFLELPTDIQIWKYIWGYILFQIFLYKTVSSNKLYYGPRQPLSNDIYIHYDNSFNCYLINLFILFYGILYYPEIYQYIYTKYGYFLATSSANTCLWVYSH